MLILDDYHLITEQEVHTTLLYLVEHLPPQLHIILATRADPPLPLPLLQTRRQILEVRTDELRCTVEETRTFFHEVMHIHLLDEMIQEVTTRTEGWLVGLQLLALSLQGHADPTTLLEEVSGDQHYILDYLTEDVLRRQPPEVQTFLLYTSILEQLNASLCDAVMELHDSQQMLQRLEQANLFVVSLDSKRVWYRYHALFAQALHYCLEQRHADLILLLHHRASIWYASHDQTTQAILHAFSAHQWSLAADLISQKSLQLLSLTWGAGERKLAMVQRWLEQLPIEVMQVRPHLCLASTQLLWMTAPHSIMEGWLDAAETTLTASLTAQVPQNALLTSLASEVQQDQVNLLGEIIAWHALLRSYQEDGPVSLALCERALSLLSPENFLMRSYVSAVQLEAAYASSVNNAVLTPERVLQAGKLAKAAGPHALAIAITFVATAVRYLLGAGLLYEALQITQQAFFWGTKPDDRQVMPDVGWPTFFQADVLREWNHLDEALTLVLDAISLCKQTESIASLMYLFDGYTMLVRVSLSCGDLDTARSAFHQFEQIAAHLSQTSYIHHSSFFMTIDQVRLWLACGELDRATLWAQKLDQGGQDSTSFAFARERQEVAHARIFLAKAQPALALQHLEPIVVRATTGRRWGHVIEMRILQALAHQMLLQEREALDTLSEAVRLAEPGGYVRSFIDEGTPMEILLYRLRRKQGPNSYLDMLLAAFQQQTVTHLQKKEYTKAQALPEPLSQRELQVLQLLAQGASNQKIAQELVIVIDTVKRHVSHIFSKLGVQNRVQAVRQARELGLLGEEG